jgi:uncharacterized protein (DUF1800 family)
MRLPRLAVPAAALLLPALAFAQSAPATLTLEDARHLLVRTGFAALPREIAAFEGLTRAEAVRRILAGARSEAATPPPAWTHNPTLLRPPGRDASEEERRAYGKRRADERLQMTAWWYREMVETPSPLTERMTLFWHNHFTSGFRKVRAPILLYRQNVTLRRHALGNFRKFVHAIAADPAMILYLDSAQNRRGKPNENFARELLELFTLGEGQGYTEADIKEAARAFTGWTIDRDNGAFRFRRDLHDEGEMTFLGRNGRFDGGDIIEILLTKGRVAEYITEKSWREFVSETPDPAEVRRIAAKFRSADYDIKVLIGELLLSPRFWDPANRGRLVQSPVELIAGTLRQFALPLPDDLTLLRLGRALGQEPFNPPNVKGWPGGTAWIDANTLLLRQQLLRRLMAGAPPGGERQTAEGEMQEQPPATKGEKRASGRQRALERRMARRLEGADLDAWHAKLDPAWQRPERLTVLLLPIPPVNPPRPDSDPARFIRDLALDPAFQLK